MVLAAKSSFLVGLEAVACWMWVKYCQPVHLTQAQGGR
jgi:hypothetical protein